MLGLPDFEILGYLWLLKTWYRFRKMEFKMNAPFNLSEIAWRKEKRMGKKKKWTGTGPFETGRFLLALNNYFRFWIFTRKTQWKTSSSGVQLLNMTGWCAQVIPIFHWSQYIIISAFNQDFAEKGIIEVFQ